MFLYLRVDVLVVASFLAIGAFVGFLIALPHDLFAFGGGGHGHPSVSLPYWKVFAAGALGVVLALGVTCGMWRNNPLSRWFAVVSVFAFSLLLVVLIGVWQYPGGFILAALTPAAISVAYIFVEVKVFARGSSDAGA